VGPNTISVISELLAIIGRMILEAFNTQDPSKLRKITDILPDEGTLKSRAALALEEEITRQQLGNG